ncbi:hypothetical protein V8C43DRAFT_295115 [Trichoderma afarasin]
MPDEGAPLYLKRVTAIISMCNLWCHLWYYRHLPKLAPWSFRPPKLRPKELLTLHAHEPTNTLSPPRQIPGVKLRIAPSLYSYRGLASPIMVEDPRELVGELLLPVVLPAGSSCHACFCLDAPMDPQEPGYVRIFSQALRCDAPIH